jgi:long-chain acyl-CoA synthetase
MVRVATSGIVSAAQLRSGAVAAAGELAEWGVRPGDRVLVKADNSAAFTAALLGLVHLGASIMLVDGGETAAETHRRSVSARARWAVVDAPVDVGPATPIPLGGLAGRAAASARRYNAPQLSTDRWASLDTALIAWSSGSTAQPKAIVKEGGTVLANLRRTAERMRYRPSDVLLPLLPFTHWYGMSLVFLAWMSDASLLLTRYRQLPQVLDAARRYGPTVVDATPNTYQSLARLVVRRPESRGAFGTIRMWCVGGAPTGDVLRSAMRHVTDLPLLDGYGSTEAGNVALATPERATALPGICMRVEDDQGDELPRGQVGDVVLQTPDLMTGYLDDGGELRRLDGSWYRTGDIGHLDDGGNLFVVGRRSAVHRLGHTIHLEALERRAEAVGRPVCIVALNDERRGCRLVFVVEDPDGRPASEWRHSICEAVPASERPNQVVVLPQLPVGRTGKVDRARLIHLVGGGQAAGREPVPA